MTSSNNDFQNALALTGPTASGKSAAAMLLAQHFDLEIISVDSALVYSGMDIGTAKPSTLERSLVAHHLLDVRSPLEVYSAADFLRDAAACSRDIQARGKRVLFVGGTMMYFHALRTGLDDLPAADRRVRETIEQNAAVEGWPAMHARLMVIDPETAQRLSPNDAQRIQRALEVHEVSGQPLSSFLTKRKALNATNEALSAEAFNMPMLSLEPTRRELLHERIAERFDAMLVQGLIDEVRQLRQTTGLSIQSPSMRCVGYRQTWQALDDAQQRGNDLNVGKLREEGIAATRQLAKRQLTWLRKMVDRSVVPCDADPVVAMAAVLAWANRFWA
jgi:tRNA dimethylallyltransferase